MTREELIEMLKILKGQALKSCKDTAILDVKIDSFIFVIDKAIEVLAQQPCDYYDADNKTCRRSEVPKELCTDCISRQAVLDTLDKSKYSNEFCEEHHIDWSINLGMAHIVVNELKPVTPQPKTDVLDKIRAEIEQMNCIDYVKPVTVDEVLEIIDKYKAESEGT